MVLPASRRVPRVPRYLGTEQGSLSRLAYGACSLFARRYWGNRDCFLFLRVLRWFTSPGWLRRPMYSDGAIEDYPRWVAPFGDLRVKARLRLTEAYRSLPRPSSPSCAKASTVRP